MLMKLSFVLFLSFWRSLLDYFVTFLLPKDWDNHIFMLFVFTSSMSFSMVLNSLPLKPYPPYITKIKTKPKSMRNICKTD